MSGHVVVCGMSDVGLRVVEQLHLAGVTVLVVDDTSDARRTRLVHRWGVTVIGGDARRRETLERCHLDTAAAVVCAAADDLEDLAIALAVRERHPSLRLVVQLSNAEVGRAVAGVLGPGGVLDVAQLAVPSFVEACLSSRLHELDLGGEVFVVADLVAPRGGTLRAIFGDLTPVAVIDGAQDMAICPGRDLAVSAGARVTVVGTSNELAGHLPVAEQHETDDSPGGRLRTGWRLTRGFLAGTERPIRITLGALGVVALISVALLLLAYRKAEGAHMSPLDAVYFTVETLATVGFGDYSFAGQSPWLRVWAILLMFIGALLVTVTYALLTNYLISRRIADSLGRRLVTDLRDHVVLVGLGAVGMRVLEALRGAGRRVVVIERDSDNRFLSLARAMEVPIVIGDATLPQTLDAANLQHASAVALLTSNDLANIEGGLVVEARLGARRRDVPVVMRVFDRELARAIETTFGFRYVRSTSALAAPWFVGAALGLDILNTFYVEQQPFLLGRLTVAGALDGRAMLDIGARVRVLAVERAGGGVLHLLRREDCFAAGDVAYVLGPYEELLQVLASSRSG